MKNTWLTIVVAGILLNACSNAEVKKEQTKEDTQTVEEAAYAGPADPVCGMPKDSTFTEYTVINGDTSWFCSETCKHAFVANPKKYTAK